jgi:transcription elongation GreA/GreB family factor
MKTQLEGKTNFYFLGDGDHRLQYSRARWFFYWPSTQSSLIFNIPMDAEIQKAVDAGKITSHAGGMLAALKPGTYCLHKSWGFGQINSINFLVNQITIDFQTKKGHTMQLQYAAESLQAIPNEHILARKVIDLAGVKTKAKQDPVGLVASILKDLGGKATQDQIAQTLQGDLFTETEFKRWWDSTKKLMKKDGHFFLPAKKTDPIELREEAVSRADELLGAFNHARQLKWQLAALDQIIKNIDAFGQPAVQLEPVTKAVEQSARQSQRLHTSQALELLLARDEICQKTGLTPAGYEVSQILKDEERRLTEILPEIPAAKQRYVLGEFPKAFGEQWPGKVLSLMLRSNIRVVSEIARLLQEQGRHEDLRKELDRWIRDHSITTEILYWLCKERGGEFGDLIHPRVFSAILASLERDQFNEIKRGGKLHDMLLEDRELVGDILATAEAETVRDAVRKLILTPVFEELNKRSLLGRIIRIYPEMQSLLTGEGNEEKQEALIVSWESLEKRKLEYEDLVNKKIPENTKEISIARSYGDLRENFEFKAAKEMQRVLMRRKSETEHELSRARGTNFENPDTGQVSIGTVVTLKNVETGAMQTYSLLGAWDSNPANGVISYLTAIGQALLGHKEGEEIDLPTEHGTERVAIISIEAHRTAAATA